MKAIMIDIETLSLAPTAAVTQLGFCAADLATGEYLVQPKNIFIEAYPGVDINLDTIGWWMRQSDAARQAVFPDDAFRVHPMAAHEILRGWYEDLSGKDAGVTVWSSPAMFDLPILTHAWGNKKPWPYYMERDLMTLYKMLDPEKKLKPMNPGRT
jgi:hypothetical protein